MRRRAIGLVASALLLAGCTAGCSAHQTERVSGQLTAKGLARCEQIAHSKVGSLPSPRPSRLAGTIRLNDILLGPAPVGYHPRVSSTAVWATAAHSLIQERQARYQMFLSTVTRPVPVHVPVSRLLLYRKVSWVVLARGAAGPLNPSEGPGLPCTFYSPLITIINPSTGNVVESGDA